MAPDPKSRDPRRPDGRPGSIIHPQLKTIGRIIMNRSKPVTFASFGAGLLFALAMDACSSGGGTFNASAAAPTTASGHRVTVGVTNTKLVQILVGSQGRTQW
jgi:hypothetical protein